MQARSSLVLEQHTPTSEEDIMTDGKPFDASTENFENLADKSLGEGIADESAGYEKAIDQDENDDVVAEGHWKSTDDGSGTSETD